SIFQVGPFDPKTIQKDLVEHFRELGPNFRIKWFSLGLVLIFDRIDDVSCYLIYEKGALTPEIREKILAPNETYPTSLFTPPPPTPRTPRTVQTCPEETKKR